ncbi:MAG: hypothetical protein ACOCP8_08150 [archaeon]
MNGFAQNQIKPAINLLYTGENKTLQEETELICSECTPNQTIKEFLDNVEDENKKEQYKNYLIDYIGLEYDYNLFVE